MSQTNNSAPQDDSDARKRLAMDYARQLLRTPWGKHLVEAYKKDPERVLQSLKDAQNLRKNTTADDSDVRKRLAIDYAKQLLRTPLGMRLVAEYKKDPDRVLQVLRAAQVVRRSSEYIRDDPKLQKDIIELYEIKKSLAPRDQLALEDAYTAACGMALSGNLGDYKRYADKLVAAQNKICENAKNRDAEAVKTLGENVKVISEELRRFPKGSDNVPVPHELSEKLPKSLAVLLNIGGEIICIRTLIDKLVTISQCNADTAKLQSESTDKLLEIAKRTENSSNNWAWASGIFSVVAILIAIYGVYSDKTGELIEVVKKSHPWCEQQIGAEDAKNVSEAFHAVTKAMQNNVQNKHEISRLQTKLKGTQDRLAETRKKNEELISDHRREQHNLQFEIDSLKRQIASSQSEVASLKKQIEELKKVSAPKTVPVSIPEVKK